MALFHGRFHTAVILIATLATNANAAGRTVTTGILYSTPADGVFTNPASLTDEGAASTGRLAYDNPADGYAVMYAKGGANSGKGVALNAAGATQLTAGYGMSFGFVRVGANLSLADLSLGDSDLGLGFIVGPANGFRFGGKFSSLLNSDSNNLTLAIGYAASNSYHVEFDMTAPLSSYSLSGRPYIQTTKGIKYFSKWGVGGYLSSEFGIIPPALSSFELGALLQFSWSQSLSLDAFYAPSGDPKFGFGILSRF